MTRMREPVLQSNRELAQLEFNFRVLAQAQDAETPLLERLRFLGISCTNLDEFFEIRVAALRQHLRFGGGVPGPDGVNTADALALVRARTLELVQAQYEVWNKELRPSLRKAGVHIIKRDEYTARQIKWLEGHFQREILPVLSPLGLDPA